nr:hypothetical protein [Tanacetum cinerariifolium]
MYVRVVSRKSFKKFLGFEDANVSLTNFHSTSKSSLSKFLSKLKKIKNSWDLESKSALLSSSSICSLVFSRKATLELNFFSKIRRMSLIQVDAAQIQVTTAATTLTISIDEVTLAQALEELKHTQPEAKAKEIVIHGPEESTTTTTAAIPKTKSHDKGERAQQELEANIALIESWDDVQEIIDADYQLAKRLQAEEQQELNDEEKAKLFMQLLEKKRKFFATKRAEEKRNKPPTQAQKRKIMCNYLKNIEGKYFDYIQKMSDRAFKRVNTFVDYRTELVEESFKKAEEEATEGSSKRLETELEQESAKKQKIDDDKDTAELQ